MPPTPSDDADPAPTELVVTLDDPAQRSSLRRWLTDTPEFRHVLTVGRPAVEPGQLGGDQEILRLLLDSGGPLALVVQSIMLWLKNRRRASIEVRVGKRRAKVESDSLRNASPDELAKLIRRVTRDLTGD